jgi:class 3 adenylate cyclase
LDADILEYARLMGEDEEGRLAAHLLFRSELFNPTVSGFKSRVIKSMGDGWLAELSRPRYSGVNVIKRYGKRERT